MWIDWLLYFEGTTCQLWCALFFFCFFFSWPRYLVLFHSGVFGAFLVTTDFWVTSILSPSNKVVNRLWLPFFETRFSAQPISDILYIGFRARTVSERAKARELALRAPIAPPRRMRGIRWRHRRTHFFSRRLASFIFTILSKLSIFGGTSKELAQQKNTIMINMIY